MQDLTKEDWKEWRNHPCTVGLIEWLGDEVNKLATNLCADQSNDSTQTGRGKTQEAAYIKSHVVNIGEEE